MDTSVVCDVWITCCELVCEGLSVLLRLDGTPGGSIMLFRRRLWFFMLIGAYSPVTTMSGLFSTFGVICPLGMSSSTVGEVSVSGTPMFMAYACTTLSAASTARRELSVKV